ncbi:MAG: UDP-2,3-diacylglucosamine diphosphatase [Granulosicoccaceae bacterium]|jgi:UDP-2,3-diacylglucosamine hydrolase
MTILFISDLHLDAQLPQVTHLLETFVAQESAEAEAIYILGDLFEVWVGDDDDRPATRHFIDILRRMTATGTPVYVMHGNRDFLLGEKFCAETGCSLLPDPSVIELYGKRVLLMHGDSLCTDDIEHQQTRQQLRSTQWQNEFLAKPLAERIRLAQEYRHLSREQTRNKPDAIMDVNDDAVAEVMRKYGVDELIHGHTHRPAIHDISIDGKPARRIVLGDWNSCGSVLRVDGDRRLLETYSPAV